MGNTTGNSDTAPINQFATVRRQKENVNGSKEEVITMRLG